MMLELERWKHRMKIWFSWNCFQSRGERLDICSDSTPTASGVLGPPLIRWYSQTAGNLCAYLSYAVSSRLIGWLVTGGGPRPRGSTNHGQRRTTNGEAGSRCWGFGTCDVLLFCDDPNKWLPWNIKANITLNVALSMLIFEGLNLISERG